MSSLGPFARVCRLCARRQGPFANIFGSDVDVADKIRVLLPIEIDESDGKPHKICYRCSAKVADLHEFVESCVATQRTFGDDEEKKHIKSEKNKKSKTLETWESHLKALKVSNDEYCDDLVKKALESLPGYVPDEAEEYRARYKLREFDIVLEDVTKAQANSKRKSRPTRRFTPDRETPSKRVSFSFASKEDSARREKLPLMPPDSPPPPPKSKPKPPDELDDNISFIDVSAIESIFSCKLCHRIFTHKAKVADHGCEGKRREDPRPKPEVPYPVGIFYRNLPKPDDEDEGYRPMPFETNESEYEVMSTSREPGKLVFKRSKHEREEQRKKKRSKSDKKKKSEAGGSKKDAAMEGGYSSGEDDPLFLFKNIDPTTFYEPSFVLPVTSSNLQESFISTTTKPPLQGAPPAKEEDSKRPSSSATKRKRENTSKSKKKEPKGGKKKPVSV